MTTSLRHHVVVVGAGALGSHLVQFLRSEDVLMKVVDFDRVDAKNLQSQFHTKQSSGQNKARALSQLMGFSWGKLVEVVQHKLVADNVEQLLGDATLIIDCLDNAEARTVVQSYARKNQVPCLHGALAAQGAFGRAVWDEHFVVEGGPAGAATCEDGAHLPFVALTAAFIALAAQEYLRRGKKVDYEINAGGALRRMHL